MGDNMAMESSDYVQDLRNVSIALEKDQNRSDIHFPELITDDEQEAKVFRAANLIAQKGHSDRGHKVTKADLAALIHYIADMME